MIWKHVSAAPFFLDDSMRNPYLFEAAITAPNSVAFLIGGPPALGIAYAFGLSKHEDGGASPAFGCAIALWDRAAFRCAPLIRTALASVFASHWSPHRAYALICARNALALRFAAQLGFRKEGDIREGLRYRGVWQDVTLMGLLRSELKE